MSDLAIKIENLSKQYRLGQIGTGTLSHDLNRWFAKIRGKEDPTLKIGQTNRLDTVDGDLVWALKDINLEIKKGEILGIIGKNGAGKSTLLKILSRVTGPTTGSIKVNGRIASLLEVGTGFHPELTGKENIFLNGAILGMTKAEIRKKLDEIVDFAGVAKYVDTPVKRYSSGMYVRLAFAVAAHLEPEILVVDEVLAVGDAEFQKKAIGKMQDISQGGGRTVLFVSHNMLSIKSLCSSCLVLKNGSTSMLGTVDKAIQYYASDLDFERKTLIYERNDRKGTGDLRFEQIHVLDENNNHVDNIIVGKTIKIAIKYSLKTAVQINNLQVAIALNNVYGVQIATMSNDVTNNFFTSISKDGFFVCTIDSISIVPGNYSLNIFCKINDEISDWIINTGELNIIEGDFYNTGKLIEAGQSLILLNYKWINSTNI